MRHLLFILPLLVCFISYGQTAYYFSNNGDDNNPGTMNAPFKTIAKLNKLILKPGDNVRFHSGDNFVGQINISASGTKANPIVFGSYGQGNKPIINGSVAVKNWVKLPGTNIWQASFNAKTPVTDLYINSVAAPLSRYPKPNNTPNKGYLPIASHLDRSQLTSMDETSGNWVGAELVYMPNQWAIDKGMITGQNGNTFTITKAAGSLYDIADGWGFFIQNHIRALNSDGDWCFNSNKNIVSLYYVKGNPNDRKIEITNFSAGISLIKSSNIVLYNLEIDKTANYAIYGNNVSNLTINSLKIDNSGTDAIEIRGICSDILIENNYINHSNNDGVYVYYATNFKFINNTVKNTGLKPGRGRNGSGQYIALDYTSDVGKGDVGNAIIQGNKIDSVGYDGISFWASNILVKNNVISNFCLIKSDGGGIYTSTRDQQISIKQTITGNIVLGDHVDPVPIRNVRPTINGIYLDDCSQNVVVSNNTIANCVNNGIFLHGAKNIDISGNTCYNNGGQFCLNRSGYGCDNTNIKIHSNIFFSKTMSQPAAIFGKQNKSDNDYGQFGNNFYINPDPTQSLLSGFEEETKNSKRISLDDWKTQYGKDMNSISLGGPQVFNNEIKFVYNDSSQPQTVQLKGNYKDVMNNIFDGQISVPPYSSAILLKMK